MLSVPNPEDFNDSAQKEQDKQLMVRFYLKEVEDKKETLETGRPMFKEVEYIEIRIAGKQYPQAARPATLRDKARFPEHYAAFKKRVEMPEHGTPLKEWPQVTKNQVDQLSFLGVKTVENLAAMADNLTYQMHGGQTLKQRAIKWLEHANDNRLIAENDALKERIGSLEDKLNEIIAASQGSAIPHSALDDPETVTAQGDGETNSSVSASAAEEVQASVSEGETGDYQAAGGAADSEKALGSAGTDNTSGTSEEKPSRPRGSRRRKAG